MYTIIIFCEQESQVPVTHSWQECNYRLVKLTLQCVYLKSDYFKAFSVLSSKDSYPLLTEIS